MEFIIDNNENHGGIQMLKTNLQKSLISLLVMVSTFFTWAAIAQAESVELKVLTPRNGDIAGVGSRGFLVDLRVRFDGNLASTEARLELTGPGPLANVGPFPGDFSPGHDPSFPGLVVLLSTSKPGSGPGQNLANLFNIVAVTNRTEDETEIWATWIIGAPGLFGNVGEMTESQLFVAIVSGDAPDTVSDIDGDMVFDEKDLEEMGYEVISNTRKVNFVVNGNN